VRGWSLIGSYLLADRLEPKEENLQPRYVITERKGLATSKIPVSCKKTLETGGFFHCIGNMGGSYFPSKRGIIINRKIAHRRSEFEEWVPGKTG